MILICIEPCKDHSTLAIKKITTFILLENLFGIPLGFLFYQPCSLLSGQQQTNVISTIQTSKLGKAQNIKVIGYRISFPELQENLNSDLR